MSNFEIAFIVYGLVGYVLGMLAVYRDSVDNPISERVFLFLIILTAWPMVVLCSILEILRSIPEKWLADGMLQMKRHHELETVFGLHPKGSLLELQKKMCENLNNIYYELCIALGSDLPPP